MPGVNRHRPPSTEQLFSRVYRQQVKTKKVVKDLQAEVARLKRTELMARLTADCERLLLEKREQCSRSLRRISSCRQRSRGGFPSRCRC